MTNKEKLQEQAKKLQQELDKLKTQIDCCDNEDIFTATTYKEVCKRLKVKEDKNPFNKIKHLEQYFNQGWKPNWSNKNEYKWYPYYTLNSSSGLVFLGSDGYHYRFYGCVWFFKTKEISDFIGKTFISIYEEIKG